MPKTRFGIIGCGSAAVPVCAALAASPLTALAVVHDLDQAQARDLGERYGVPYTPWLDELLAADLDAVYVAVPHHLLAPLARQALRAGKHTLVEKPLALTLEEIDELIVLAQAKALALGVFYEMRYADGFARAHKLIRSNALGKIAGVRIQTLIDKPLAYWQVGYSGRSANPWRGEKIRAGGGVTLMNTSHLLDALLYVTGMKVTRVSAEMGTLVAPVEVEDTLAATLRFDNGALGSLFASAHSVGAAGGERLEIYGTRGTLRIPDPYGNRPVQLFLREGWGDIPTNAWHRMPATPRNVFAEAVNDFARAIQRREPAPIDGYAARRVLEIVLGMYRAAEEQCVVGLEAKEQVYATS